MATENMKPVLIFDELTEKTKLPVFPIELTNVQAKINHAIRRGIEILQAEAQQSQPDGQEDVA